jgi:histidine triad (HIT) family protein
MYHHAPASYDCPFCRNVRDGTSDLPLEVLHRDDEVFVKMNPKWWPNNPGGALVIPVDHHENVYDLPVGLGTPLQRSVRATALAMKAAYRCDGVSTRQHNEPAGHQDVWHYHVHVFPRFEGDDLYRLDGARVSAELMREYADRLRAVWSQDPA